MPRAIAVFRVRPEFEAMQIVVVFMRRVVAKFFRGRDDLRHPAADEIAR
jgi:hypothetical protein